MLHYSFLFRHRHRHRRHRLRSFLYFVRTQSSGNCFPRAQACFYTCCCCCWLRWWWWRWFLGCVVLMSMLSSLCVHMCILPLSPKPHVYFSGVVRQHDGIARARRFIKMIHFHGSNHHPTTYVPPPRRLSTHTLSTQSHFAGSQFLGRTIAYALALHGGRAFTLW